MRTLHLRDVPNEVAKDLEALAAREGMSLSAFVVRELTERVRELTARVSGAHNRALLEDLPDLDISMEDVVASLAG